MKHVSRVQRYIMRPAHCGIQHRMPQYAVAFWYLGREGGVEETPHFECSRASRPFARGWLSACLSVHGALNCLGGLSRRSRLTITHRHADCETIDRIWRILYACGYRKVWCVLTGPYCWAVLLVLWRYCNSTQKPTYAKRTGNVARQ